MKSYIKNEHQNNWNYIFIWRDLMLVHAGLDYFHSAVLVLQMLL